MSGRIEHDGPGGLDLAHAELPPIASQPIDSGERARDAGDPVVEERLQLCRTQSIADGLQAGWVFAGREPIGKLGEREAFGSRLTLGPLVPVHPHLQWVREIAADLDEAKAERWVKDVEVVDRHSAIGFVEAKLW